MYKLLELMVIFLFNTRLSWKIDDILYLKIVYRIFTRKKLDLDNPKTFNEKLQWLKIYDRKDLYSRCADKYEMREFVKECVGEEYLVPIIGVYDKINEIDFSELPDKFVIKTTHDSGTAVICSNKDYFNVEKCIKRIEWSLKRKYYYLWREWPYKNIKPRIIIEEKLGNDVETPSDYKILCFNGKAQILEYHVDRYKEHKQFFYDRDCKLLSFNNVGYSNKNAPVLELNNNIKKMFEIADVISKYFIHIRVDFYCVESKIYIGELTFYDGAGIIPFTNNGDEYLGDLLSLESGDNK